MNLDAPHLHLIVNHIPVLGTVLAALFGLYGLLRRQNDVVRLALWTLAVLGLFALAADRTGGAAEEAVEDLAGVSRRLIHRHEEAAEWGAVGSYVEAGLALVALFLSRRSLNRPVAFAVIALGLLLGGWMGYVANLGGEIRHPEIRPPGTTSAQAVHGSAHLTDGAG